MERATGTYTGTVNACACMDSDAWALHLHGEHADDAAHEPRVRSKARAFVRFTKLVQELEANWFEVDLFHVGDESD